MPGAVTLEAESSLHRSLLDAKQQSWPVATELEIVDDNPNLDVNIPITCHTASDASNTDHDVDEDTRDQRLGLLSSRYNISPASVILRDEFTGGPEIGSHGYSATGGRRPEPSESGATVESVYDLGLGALQHDSTINGPSQSVPIDSKSSIVDGQDDVRLSLEDMQEMIQDEVQARLCWSKSDNKEFLPNDALEQIFSPTRIQTLVQSMPPRAADEATSPKVRQIVGDATRSRRLIMGILVFMKQATYIKDFIREGIFDHHMPLRHDSRSMREFKARLGSDEADRLNTTLFSSWERAHVDLFYIYQKMMVVPYFKMDDETLRSYVLDDDTRLPWAKYTHKTSGGHGVIHQLQIHPSHYSCASHLSNKSGRPQCFAVKELHPTDHDSHRHELRALEKACAKVQKEACKHLIKLLLTFQHGNRLYLVFEWADGNLQEFWYKRECDKTPHATKWMSKQCMGITSAIKRVHGLATWQRQQRQERESTPDGQIEHIKDWGRHGDIKPSNILWFSTYGEDGDHLVVADLGLTRYHSLLTKSRVLRVDGFTGTYRAPEIDLGGPISAKYDIWSLGCVFLEFCIWFVYGADAIKSFEIARRRCNLPKDKKKDGEPDNSYFTTRPICGGGKTATLNEAVNEWVGKLKADLKQDALYSSYINDMLDLITNQMLVVDPSKRSPSIQVVSLELSDIDAKLQQSLKRSAVSPVAMETNTNNNVQKETLVKFAEGNSVMGEEATAMGLSRGRKFSISE
ncbi:Homeodomain-interacting protein kinase 4 [Colletotrichum trifolii]|uniref:Homeodomain-interacting protein kinase 4 n=1 Tax=Colletotrichum trifolii TaxID=5466 RepID=A0A4R8RJI5_COLTR|nr:Homeodomain-interacting protein kinase 4 [Colletotrichum trifolii]